MSTVAVGPTETVVATIATRGQYGVGVQVTNLDGAQTFEGTVYATIDGESWAPSTLPDLQGIGPGASRLVQVGPAGAVSVQVRGYMSGAGGDVSVAVMG